MAAPDERKTRLNRARLYLVIEAGAAREVVPGALAGGVDVVQLREKHAADDEIVAVGRELREMCSAAGALLVVNDRPDLALHCGADGLHLGQEDEDVAAARRLVGPDLLIGLSTHSSAQVDAAEAASEVDYLGVGPVFETATKPGLEPVGVELVGYAREHVTKPWFAIGGIDAERAAQIGAERIAVVRAIRDADDPRAAARELCGRVASGQAQ
jgi:thiamine-phosphate pyrophosphorylase